MGQYHVVVNLDKKEFLNPHFLGAGLKLWEQFANHPGTCAPLIPLLACSNGEGGRGGGDFREDPDEIVGRWAGDRIAIVGDYAEPEDLAPEHRAETIYDRCVIYPDRPSEPVEDPYTDISPMVASFIERELGGKYKGEGWRTFDDGSSENPLPAMRPDLVITTPKK